MIIDAILKKHKPTKNNLLTILHEIQENSESNFIEKNDIVKIAAYLNTSLAQVYGVINYYSMFDTKARGKNIITVCNSTVCHLKDSKKITHYIEEFLGIKLGSTTSDLKFTLEPTECLGHCDEAPVMSINNKIYGNLNKEKVIDILKKYDSSK
ncbi:MAG: NAD(P)H-dependent oxidoreductase subunit E [Bacteroidota bacterium]|nr:NAD(P)H-dependent oxidoreductase subunit E [Bacteroidota bacterium]